MLMSNWNSHIHQQLRHQPPIQHDPHRPQQHIQTRKNSVIIKMTIITINPATTTIHRSKYATLTWEKNPTVIYRQKVYSIRRLNRRKHRHRRQQQQPMLPPIKVRKKFATKRVVAMDATKNGHQNHDINMWVHRILIQPIKMLHHYLCPTFLINSKFVEQMRICGV